MDAESDRKNRLHSIPQRFGVDRALRIAWVAHGIMVFFLLALLATPLLGPIYLVGVVIVAGLLGYQHTLVSKDDLSRVNFAFFNVNSVISVLLMSVVIVDSLWL